MPARQPDVTRPHHRPRAITIVVGEKMSREKALEMLDLLPLPHQQSQTILLERRAEAAIRSMRKFLPEPPSIQELAEEARVTPWHFIRIFRRAVGIPPGAYLAALRIAQAKKLLLDTPDRVTDICFDLGFESLGSFTSRFTRLVGVSPTAFRRLADEFSPRWLEDYLILQERMEPDRAGMKIRGTVRSPYPFRGPIFIGFFPKPIPEGFPQAGILLMEPGPFEIPHALPSGYLMAAGIVSPRDPRAYLVPTSSLLVGVLPLPRGSAREALVLDLRPSKPLDPPILLALLGCLVRPDPACFDGGAR